MSTPSDPPDRPKHPSSRPPPSRPRKPTDVLLNDEAVIKVIAGVLRHVIHRFDEYWQLQVRHPDDPQHHLEWQRQGELFGQVGR